MYVLEEGAVKKKVNNDVLRFAYGQTCSHSRSSPMYVCFMLISGETCCQHSLYSPSGKDGCVSFSDWISHWGNDHEIFSWTRKINVIPMSVSFWSLAWLEMCM